MEGSMEINNNQDAVDFIPRKPRRKTRRKTLKKKRKSKALKN